MVATLVITGFDTFREASSATPILKEGVLDLGAYTPQFDLME